MVLDVTSSIKLNSEAETREEKKKTGKKKKEQKNNNNNNNYKIKSADSIIDVLPDSV